MDITGGYAFYNTIGGFVHPTHNTVHTFSSTSLTAVNSSVRNMKLSEDLVDKPKPCIIQKALLYATIKRFYTDFLSHREHE